MTLTTLHLHSLGRLPQRGSKPLLVSLLGAWLTTHTLSAFGDTEGASVATLERVADMLDARGLDASPVLTTGEIQSGKKLCQVFSLGTDRNGSKHRCLTLLRDTFGHLL